MITNSFIKLKDILEEFEDRLGSRPEPEILTLTEKKGFISQRQRFSKRLAIADTSNYKLIGLNDIAFNPYLLWACAIAQNVDWQKAIISPLYPTFRVRKGFSPRFVNYLLCSEYLRSHYGSISHGSVPRKRRAAVKDFLELKITQQPPLPEQERIVKLLDEVDGLRKLRIQADQRFADLIPALFHKTFDDEKSALANWPRKQLKDLTEVITKGTTPQTSGRKYESSGIPFLRVENLQGGEIVIDEETLFIDAATHAHLRRSVIYPNDILLSIAGTIGRGSIVPLGSVEMNCNQAVAIVRPMIDRIEPMFLLAWLQSSIMQHQMGKAKVTQTVSNLSLGQIKLLAMNVPPLSLQREFVQQVAEIRDLVSIQSTSRKRMDDLFRSMLHWAFEGEL